ncbi:MAG: sulfatase [Verrucomicrobiota bacterium]|nr:sulfatase [Verrucomicrobiota bacterium]
MNCVFAAKKTTGTILLICRIPVLLLILVFSFFPHSGRGREPAPKRPNLVFLMTDNQRRDALGCYANPVIKTPNIDRLAAQGFRFTNAFCTTSICAATRATILTGRHRRSHGYTFEKPPMTLAAMAQSYPAILKSAGYHTGFVGKIGVRLKAGVSEEMFDFFKANQASSTRQPYYRKSKEGTLRHLTSINGDHAIDFLRGASATRPFCLSVSFSAPHPEDDNSEQYIFDHALTDLYRDVVIPAPPVSQPRHFAQLPGFLRVSMSRQRWFRRFDTPDKYQKMMKAMYRMITGVDIQVGRILAEIRKLGLEENTIIIYTSDNGLLAGEHGLTGIWLMYEPSIRLPLIIHDPRQPQAARGKTVPGLALDVDFGPTLLDFAGVEVPDAMQGRSLVPLLKGKVAGWPQDFFYGHYFRPSWLRTNKDNIPSSEGLRSERWKYVHYFDEKPPYEQLFDLKADPHEINNLAGDPGHAETLEILRRRLALLRDKAGPIRKPSH